MGYLNNHLHLTILSFLEIPLIFFFLGQRYDFHSLDENKSESILKCINTFVQSFSRESLKVSGSQKPQILGGGQALQQSSGCGWESWGSSLHFSDPQVL